MSTNCSMKLRAYESACLQECWVIVAWFDMCMFPVYYWSNRFLLQDNWRCLRLRVGVSFSTPGLHFFARLQLHPNGIFDVGCYSQCAHCGKHDSQYARWNTYRSSDCWSGRDTETALRYVVCGNLQCGLNKCHLLIDNMHCVCHCIFAGVLTAISRIAARATVCPAHYWFHRAQLTSFWSNIHLIRWNVVQTLKFLGELSPLQHTFWFQLVWPSNCRSMSQMPPLLVTEILRLFFQPVSIYNLDWI